MKTKMYEVVCPECGCQWMIPCETLVHAQNESALRERIIERSFFTRKCSKCGKMITFYYPFLYCDMKEKFLIALASEDTKWVHDLDALEQYKDFRKRLVIDEVQLREKILIFENHLEDEGIALIKNKLRDKYQTFHFDGLDENGLLWFTSDKGPVGVEKRFYQPMSTNSKKFIYV